MFNPGGFGFDGISEQFDAAERNTTGGAEVGGENGRTIGQESRTVEDEDEDEGAVDVIEQRRRALEALSGGDNKTSQEGASPVEVHQSPATKQKRQSRMIPGPSKSKSAMPPPAGLGRASSVRKATPGNAGDRSSRIVPPSAAATAGGRSHLRNTSTVGTSGRPLSRSNTTTSTTARPSSSASAASQTSQSRATRPDLGTKRAHSTKDADTSRGHSRTASALPSLQARPQFNTFQQHYSPKKSSAPKPPTSSYLQSSTARPINVSTSPLGSPVDTPSAGSETFRQQIELLQLHLLHASALPSLAQFEASAEAKFRKRFEGLSKRSAAVRQKEREARTARNVAALNDWGVGAAENLQVLGSILRELSTLSGSGVRSEAGTGRHDRIVSDFARWKAWVEDVWHGREEADSGNADEKGQAGGAKFELIEPLGESWHVEVGAVQRKVALLLRELDGLDEPAPGSSVAAVVDACRQHLAGTAEELMILRQLSDGVIKKEERWIDEKVSKLDLTVSVP